MFNDSSNTGVVIQKEFGYDRLLLKEFLQKEGPLLGMDETLEEAYYAFEDKKKEEKVLLFSQSQDLPEDLIEAILSGFQFINRLNRNGISVTL